MNVLIDSIVTYLFDDDIQTGYTRSEKVKID